MYPDLGMLFGYRLNCYGLLIVIGMLIGLIMGRRLMVRAGYNPKHITDGIYWGVIVGVIGAKCLYIFVTFLQHGSEAFSLHNLLSNGLVWYGGIICALLFVYWHFRRVGVPLLPGLDISAPLIAIGHAFGRIGCFLAGCCYGRPTQFFFGVQFSHGGSAEVFPGMALHPTQLYEAGGLFFLFFLLMRRLLHRRFEGEVFFLYMMGYALLRMLVENFRGDALRGFILGGLFSVSQLISIGFFFVGLYGYLSVRKCPARN